jgi:transcriptional accessory protein Tex/SPT6
LDGTRVHPEAYSLAMKMAAGVLEEPVSDMSVAHLLDRADRAAMLDDRGTCIAAVV